MAKKKRKPRKVTRATRKKATPPSFPASTGPSFSLEAIEFLSVLGYNIRETIQNQAIERSEEKKNIPRSTVEDVARQLNLNAFMSMD